jgi:hypothetical protein
MTKDEYLSLAETKWKELEQLKTLGNFYDYEKRFSEIWVELGRAVLEGSIGEVPVDRRKKKILTRLGEVEIANRNQFSAPVHGFRISPLMQELMAYTGQWEVYGKGAEVLEKLAQVKVSATQLYRVANTYGEQLEEELIKPQAALPVSAGMLVYAEMDGGMVFTDEGWQEVKVGRVFREEDCHKSPVEGRGGNIGHSEYAAYLGHYQGFAQRFEPLVRPYEHIAHRLVFLTDGALWMRGWMEKNFPLATQILDFRHVKDHLAALSEQFFAQAGERKDWVEQQAGLLLSDGFDEVMRNLRSLKPSSEAARKEQAKQENYLLENRYRMDYKTYVDSGLFIGSGAIEASHRTVVQRRLKLSGQRWTPKGAATILNLRVTYMSNKWGRVVDLIRNYKPVSKAA